MMAQFIPASSGGGGASFAFDGVTFSGESGGSPTITLTLGGVPVTDYVFAFLFVTDENLTTFISPEFLSFVGVQPVTSATYPYLYMFIYPGSTITLGGLTISGGGTYKLNVLLPSGAYVTSAALASPPPPG